MKFGLGVFCAGVLAVSVSAETLYNGIKLPAEWPPGTLLRLRRVADVSAYANRPVRLRFTVKRGTFYSF